MDGNMYKTLFTHEPVVCFLADGRIKVVTQHFPNFLDMSYEAFIKVVDIINGESKAGNWWLDGAAVMYNQTLVWFIDYSLEQITMFDAFSHRVFLSFDTVLSEFAMLRNMVEDAKPVEEHA
jgi:hypothetical protein